jgi:F0F1-type ATP synthase membrane subunit b/b'
VDVAAFVISIVAFVLALASFIWHIANAVIASRRRKAEEGLDEGPEEDAAGPSRLT